MESMRATKFIEMVLRGGRSRFVVESKWFEIVIEELGGRL